MRQELSYKWIQGSGIELGACHNPMPVKPGVQVTYVDLMTTEQLKIEAPQLQIKDLSHVIDNGETLSKFADSSQDFVMSSHVAEHLENLLRGIENWLRVLKPGGVILAFIPDKEQCFDRKRETTPYWHLMKDYTDGPDWSLRGHYMDWFLNSGLEGKLFGKALDDRVDAEVKARHNIHFHTFDFASMNQLAFKINGLFKLKHIEVIRNGPKLVLIAQKI